MPAATMKILIFALLLAFPLASAEAAGDLTQQEPVEIRVALGNEKDALRFFPEALSLEAGKLYRLILVNPSPQKHYFSSEGMAQSVFTRKVQVNGADGKAIAEVKGHDPGNRGLPGRDGRVVVRARQDR
jgi:uncharacterized cupredoxin-like copper-binding protein